MFCDYDKNDSLISSKHICQKEFLTNVYLKDNHITYNLLISNILGSKQEI